MAQVFWVDEEENVAYPDVKYLEYSGHTVIQTYSAGEALDWFVLNKSNIHEYSAFVIDIQLPIFDDERFESERSTHGAFAGLKLCELVKNMIGESNWKIMRKKFLLYTRLPETNRMVRIEDFARKEEISFYHKTHNISLVENLTDLGLL